MRSSNRCWIALVLATATIAACGPDYPSRDWSGSYLTRMIASSSDCHEAPVPPPVPEFLAELEQRSDNQATLWINPLIQLKGSFDGDELHVTEVLVDSIGLPDTLRQRIEPADSFEAVAYDFRGEFENWRFRAEYVIRSPDIRALVRGVRPLRCTLRYQLVGARFEPPALSEQPWMRDLGADTAPPAVPSDTAVRGDTSTSTDVAPEGVTAATEGPAGLR